MTEKETFIRADEELKKVVDHIKDDQWDMPMPPDFPNNRNYTLRDIIKYQAYDEAWIPAMMEGKTIEEVGKETFGEPFGVELLGENPKEDLSGLIQKAIAAVRELDNADLDERTVHYSYGDYPAREALLHAVTFRGLRVYDLSKALGLPTEMAPDLVEGLWENLGPHAEEWRAMGVYGPKIDVPDDAPLQDRLLGLTGRQP